jgi:hypothetical protein
MPTTIQVKRSSVSGRAPAANQLAVGELALNTADRKLYSKDSAGTVFRIGQPDPSTYLFLSAATASELYLGRLAWDDYPATGPAENSTAWVIYKISTNSAGDVVSEQSATGAWSSKESLSYS